jgi:FkbM family methyltransferase
MNWAMAREVGALDYILRRVLWRLHRLRGRTLAFPLPDGAKVALPLESPFAADIYCTQGYVDWGSEQMLVQYLQTLPKGVCIDVGANMGYYSCILSLHATEVIAFEPDPRNHAALRAQNIPNLTLIANAVSDVIGNASFDVSGTSAVGHLHPGAASTAQIDVEMTTLDAWWKSQRNAPRVTAVKMDIEGHEIAALRGANELVEANQPVLLIEYGMGDGLPNTIEELDAWLGRHRYEMFAMIRRPAPLWRFRTVLEKVHASDLPSLDFKMLFLVPLSDDFFTAQALSGFCFETIRNHD